MVGDFDEQSDDYTPLEDEDSNDDEQDEDKKEKKKKQKRPRRKRQRKKPTDKKQPDKTSDQQQSDSQSKDVESKQKGSGKSVDKAPKEAPTVKKDPGVDLGAGKDLLAPTTLKDSVGQFAGNQLKALENKSPAIKKVADAVRATKQGIKTAKQGIQTAKEFPKKMAKKAVSKATAPIRRAAVKAGQKVVAKIGEKAAGKAAIAATRATGRAAQVVLRTLNAMRLSNIMANISAKLIRPIVNLAAKALAAISAPAWIVIAVIAIAGALFFYIYTSGLNKINSLAGGSAFVSADYYRKEDRDLVELLSQRAGVAETEHILKLSEAAEFDLLWRQNDATGEWEHPLDLRILQTLKYITDRHDYVAIGLLKNGAPTLLRESLKVKKVEKEIAEGTGQEYETKTVESFSAFSLGQGMAITAVDYSEINPPYEPKTQPIEFDWQRTAVEKVTRPIWEELEFDVGYLDSNIDTYQKVSALDIGALEMSNLVKEYKKNINAVNKINVPISIPLPSGVPISVNVPVNVKPPYSFYASSFSRLERILQLLGRIVETDRGVYTPFNSKKDIFDRRTIEYIQKAVDAFAMLKGNIEYDADETSEVGLEERIREWGKIVNVELLRQGVQYAYKATQVANMVDWNEKSPAGTTKNLEWNQAYEARNKIRQVIKELVEMPRETAGLSLVGSVSSLPVDFNYDMVAKQVITYSPEDDIDNGRMNIDVFPKGITAVDVGGVAIEGTNTTTTTDANGQIVSGATIGDGIVDLKDVHFSYMPIDNGSFSKFGTNYIWVIDPTQKDKVLVASQIVLRSLKVIFEFGTMPGAMKRLYDRWVGSCDNYNRVSESCQPMSYKGFLQVSF